MKVNPLTYDECVDAMKIKRANDPNIDKISLEVITLREELIKTKFLPLLKYFIDQDPEKCIKSEDLFKLWAFFGEALHIKTINESKPKDEYSIKDYVEHGFVILRKDLHDLMYKKIMDATEKYYNLFSSDDPVEWYKKTVENFGDFDSIIRSQPDEKIIYLKEIFSAFNNNDNDPILQK